MKKYFIIILLYFFITSLYAQNAADVFNEAMHYYNNFRYSDAVKTFEKLETNFKLSDELYSSTRYYISESLLNLGKVRHASEGFEFLVNNYQWSPFRSKSLYKLGLIYFDEKKFEQSRKKFSQLLDEYPESEFTGSALYWIGESYTAEGNYNESISFLENAVADKKKNKFIDQSIYTLASTYERLGDYKNAVKYYDQLLSFHRSSPLLVKAQMRIGLCYFKLNDYQSAILELSNPNLKNLSADMHAECLYLLANSHYRVQEYNKSEEKFIEIIQTYPGSKIIRDVKYGLGWSYFQQKKYQDAFKVFNFLVEGADSISEKSAFWRAESKRYAGQETEALNLYNEFLSKYPYSSLVPAANYHLGIIYFSNNKTDLAERYLITSTSASDPTIRIKSFTMLGELALDKKQYSSAKNYFESGLNVLTDKSENLNRIKLGLGISYSFLGQPDKVIEYLSDVEEDDPSFEADKVQFFIGEALFSKGSYREAIEKYSKVNTDAPVVANLALYGKAYSYFNLADYENASYYFSDFNKKFPKDSKVVDAKLRLADSYYGNKNYEASSKIYKELFQTGGSAIDNPYVYYQYAQALFKSGNSSQAINEFRNLQQKFPASEYSDEALFTVGWIYFQQNNFDASINSYKEVLVKYPSSNLAPIVHYSIGDAYFNMAIYDSAITNYQRVLTRFPGSEYVFDAVNGIQYSYVVQGKQDLAIKTIDEFVNRNPKLASSDQIYFKKGDIYYNGKDYPKAISSYKEFILKFPGSKLIPDAYYWIGKSSQNAGLIDEAINNFTLVFEKYSANELSAASVIELANIYSARNDFNSAINILNKAISKFPKSKKIAEILFMKGEALSNNGNVSEAYGIFSEVAGEHPGTIFADKSIFELGLIDLITKRYSNAEKFFRELSESRTDEIGAKALYHLGFALFEQNKINQALVELEKVSVVFPAYDEWVTRSLILRGDCYVKLKDKRKAEEMYRIVIAKHRNDLFGIEAANKMRALK
ncbi:MAG: tetratricopeptide repeat protein [Ignavibacteriaceae bacterium]|nr:tetratricopeptide repeat protein [Ignavibacteriaceae bacterium]